MRSSILAERGFAQQPARRLDAERVDRLVLRGLKHIQAELTRGMPKTTGVRAAQKLGSCGVHQLQHVLAIKREQRRNHYFQNAREQCCRFEGANPLLLQQISKRVDFCGQFSHRIARLGAARAEGVIALAQRRHHVGESLQRPYQTLNKSARNQGKIEQQAAGDQDCGSKGDLGTNHENARKQKGRQGQKQAIEPRPADRRAIAPAHSLVIGHIFLCDGREPHGSSRAPRPPARCCRRNGAAPCGSGGPLLHRCSCFRTTASTSGTR